MDKVAEMHRFRSDLRPLGRMCRSLGLVGFAVLTGAAVIGQLRADRFPATGDLAVAMAIGPVAAVGLFACFCLLIRFFPVDVSPSGLRAYTSVGVYHAVEWSDMLDVQPFEMGGFRYLAIRCRRFRSPLTIPLWLEDMTRFRAVIEGAAGANHVLSTALRAST